MISHHKAKDVLIIADVIIVAMRKSEIKYAGYIMQSVNERLK